MKSFHLYLILLLLCIANAGVGFAQTNGIISGKIYTLKSKSSSKLLDISNASMENGANVDCWINTHSDAQRWIVTHINKDVYTLTNVASGKLLHIASDPADSMNIDQYVNTGNNDVKWIIRRAGNGYYYLKSAANTDFSLGLSAGDISDGVNVNLFKSSAGDAKKWSFQQVSPQEEAPTLAIADKVFEAWYSHYKVETRKGFWGKAEMME